MARQPETLTQKVAIGNPEGEVFITKEIKYRSKAPAPPPMNTNKKLLISFIKLVVIAFP